MCGILGIISKKPVTSELYEGLINLQHRGQDAAGIVTFNGRFNIARGKGFVREAFDKESLANLHGTIGIAHTRYATTGSAFSLGNAQPFLVNSPYGIALIHNGNLTNYQQLRRELQENEHFHCNSDSDTEALLGILATELRKASGHPDFFTALSAAVKNVFKRVNGAYSVVGIIAGKGLFAFRDPHGIRPLVYGVRQNIDGQKEYIFSSENTMYTLLGFSLVGDVGPGEVMFVDMDGKLHSKKLASAEFTPDAFEYIYFARADALINQVSVYRARLRMGQNMAKNWKKLHPDITPDLVVPVPFTSNPIALAFAHEIGVRYSEAIYKNAFIGRTFIMPGSETRQNAVRRKLSPQITELAGKDVVIVDDSIVRGTTSHEVIRMVREAGAKKVYFLSMCPPLLYPDFYGIDIPTREELISARLSDEEVCKFIGADILMFQTVEDLSEAIMRRGEHHISRLSMPYFNGEYITGDVDEQFMETIRQVRSRERVEDQVRK